MNETVLEFYDGLAEDYHLLFPDWPGPVFRQGKVLNKVIQSYLGQSRFRILDCSCGIGTQAIGLALLGHEVHASDVSSKAVERAQKEAARLEANITFDVTDFRRLDEKSSGTFDVLLSCDNALPHLLTDEDLLLTARNMHSKLNPEGLLLVSIRDYDQLVEQKPCSTLPRIFQDESGRRIVFQVWDWKECGNIYTVHQFILRASQNEWKTLHHQTEYRALLREEFDEIFKEAGFPKIQWHFPEETGYYQPIVTALKK